MFEYLANSVIWSPHLIQDITKIKSSEDFTKKLRSLKDLSYSDRLINLVFQVPSLELRRIHLDLVYCYGFWSR